MTQPAAVAPSPAPAGSLEAPLVASVQAATSPPTVVGQYASGGNSYTMFSDGSILADLPAGPRRFSSLDELRSFVAASGERS